MVDKSCGLEIVARCVSSGQTIMVGGFGVPGTPFILIDAVLNSGVTGLTLIKNEANEDGLGLAKLLAAGRADKLITSHLGLCPSAIAMMNRKELEVEFYPQGILAEKIRAGGAGLFGILTDIGVDTDISRGKRIMDFGGRRVVVEPALRADVALIHAAKADRYGNLVYEKSARNFNPLMAAAADLVIAEVEELVDIGALDPDQVHTPGAFVDHVVVIEELTAEYGILEHHAS